MKLIHLTGKTFYAIVDDEDYSLVNRYKWWAFRRYSNRTWYARTWVGDKQAYMHDLILPCNDPRLTVDHKDGKGLNNQKDNLRFATPQQQSANSRSLVGASKYKGVHRFRKTRWHAQIGVNRKKIHLGYFETEEEAAKVYNKAAIKYFGEFAKLNQIQ